MKQQIAGKEVDLLVREELAAELRTAVEQLASGYLRPPQPVRARQGVEALDGSGSGSVDVYRVDLGMMLLITRFIVEVPGSGDPETPFTSSGYGLIQRNGEMLDFVSFVSFSGGLPAVATWNESNGLRYRDGEAVVFSCVGGPADKPLVVSFEGMLAPLTDAFAVQG